jgi:lipopolysaccharide/colanic/teichoic acid biosynthesis glycosyltransferase
MYKYFFKRIIDLVFAIIIFVIALPLIIIFGLLVYLTMGRPIFFKQRRIGKNAEEFFILKFRTMRNKLNDTDTDANRLTGLGKFMRKTSIDELPQMLNIIKGEMSFIGPRPLLPEYTAHYSERQAMRLHVRPGMTGYAEIKGRHHLTWEEQFEYDVQYVENQCFINDVRIVLLTIPQVIFSKNVKTHGRKDNVRFDQLKSSKNNER